MATPKQHVYVLCLLLLPLVWAVIRFVIHGTNQSVTSVTVAVLCYIFVLRKIVIPFYTSPLRHIPSPGNDWFIFGHSPSFWGAKPKGTFPQWFRELPNNGLILSRGWFLIRTTVILMTPETLSEVLVKKAYDYEKPKFATDFLKTALGEGLVLVEGKEHRMQRKAVWPSFQGGHIRSLVPLFWRKSIEFVDVLGEEIKTGSSNGVIELGNWVSRATLDIIGVAGFGRDFGSLHNSGDELAEHFAAITDPANKRIAANFVLSFFIPQWILKHVPGIANDIIIGGTKRTRAKCLQLLSEKRAMLKEKSIDQPLAIVEVLLRTSSIDDNSIIDQLLTFLGAGHETTASAMQWVSYMLAKDQKMQQRLRDECKAAFAARGDRAVDADFIDSLPFMNALCMETLRYWPTVPVTARLACCDTSIGEQVIPKGTVVLAAPYLINRLPSLWGPDAEQFVPERWLREDGNMNGGAQSPMSFLTFLHGPRSCIGQNFAKLELKCLLAAFVTRFQFEMADPDEKIVPHGLITIKPENGLNLRLRDLSA